MELHKEPVAYRYPGPLIRGEVPHELLYDVQITFLHDAGRSVTSELTDAIETLTGAIRTRELPFFGTRIFAGDGKIPLKGRIIKDQVQLRLDHRIKGKHLTRLIDRLGRVSGASDLHVEGTVPRFHAPYADVGPCTPCAAGRYPRSRT